MPAVPLQRSVAPWAQHGYWGQFDDPSSLPNVAGSAYQVAADLQEGDIAYSVSDSALYLCVDPTSNAAVWSPINAGAGATSTLIAEWNKTDLTQFVSGGTADFSAGGATRTLSVVSVPERGNVLRYSGGAGGATMTQIFMFSAASGLLIPSTTERRDVDIEIEFYTTSFGGGGYCGAFFYGDADTPLHGFGHCGAGIAEWQSLLNNGTIERSATTGVQANRYNRYRVRGRKPAGAAPEVSSYYDGFDTGAGIVGEPRRSGSDATARGSVTMFGNNSTLGATWNSISADRIGLIFQSSGGNPAPTQIDILSFRVYTAAS